MHDYKICVEIENPETTKGKKKVFNLTKQNIQILNFLETKNLSTIKYFFCFVSCVKQLCNETGNKIKRMYKNAKNKNQKY